MFTFPKHLCYVIKELFRQNRQKLALGSRDKVKHQHVHAALILHAIYNSRKELKCV